MDLRIADEESDFPAVMAAMPETLARIHPVLGWSSRPVRGGRLDVFTFEGRLRADVEIATSAALRGPRHEAVAPLIDPDGQVAQFADEPLAPRHLTPAELIEREAARIPAELGRLQRAIEDRSILAATQAQATLLESAQRLLLLLRDPRAAGLAGPKHAADALTAADVEPHLDPLHAWSADWPDPVVDSIDPTLEILQPLVAEVRNRHGTAMPLHPEPPIPRAPGPGRAISPEARRRKLLKPPTTCWCTPWSAPAATTVGCTPESCGAMPWRRNSPPSSPVFVRGRRTWQSGSHPPTLRRSSPPCGPCAALGLSYQRRLDREVNAYLFREGVFAHDATVADPAP